MKYIFKKRIIVLVVVVCLVFVFMLGVVIGFDRVLCLSLLIVVFWRIVGGGGGV